MSYEQAFEALNSGDYRRAIELLKRAAAESPFASDLIDHALTLALYRAGEREQLAEVAFNVGLRLIQDDPGSALDYFQRALHAGLDRDRSRRIGEIVEAWAGERRPARLQGKITRVGHVVSSITPYIRMLEASLGQQGIESRIFTTEHTASWFMNPTPSPITSTEGDFIERSDRIAEAIRESALQLVFFHASLSDLIAARVAALRPAPVQVNVADESEMDADLFDGFIHLSQNTLERTRFPNYPAAWIPPSSDIEARLQQSGFESRESLGIDAGSTVSASFTGPSRTQMSFVKVVIELLKRYPRHFHFFAGASEVRAFRGLLHSEGVLSRIRFLGTTTNTTPMLGAVDLYLTPFPDAGRTSILEMMAVGKPVIAMRFASNSEFNTAAELVGEAELTPRTQAEYTTSADRLIRDAAHRARLGDRMQDRFQSEFHPNRLGERFISFLETL